MAVGKHSGWEGATVSRTWQVWSVHPWCWQSNVAASEALRNVVTCWQCADISADISQRCWQGL